MDKLNNFKGGFRLKLCPLNFIIYEVLVAQVLTDYEKKPEEEPQHVCTCLPEWRLKSIA